MLEPDNRICCLLTEKQYVKKLKCQIEKAGFSNKSYRVTKLNNAFAIPVVLPYIQQDSSNNQDTDLKKRLFHHPELNDVFTIVYLDGTKLLKSKFSTPYDRLYNYVESYMTELSIEKRRELLKELPCKWEIHNDLILFPSTSFNSDFWLDLPENFWLGVAKIFSVHRIGLISVISNDDFRTPQVKLLLGNNGWVTHVDNGITYTYDVTKNMFSKGNITEKLRVSKLNCKNEVIVDLFAGIGYFTLPYLVKAGAKKLYACEWNPDAVLALTRNLQVNNIDVERYEVRQGDNRKVLRTICDVMYEKGTSQDVDVKNQVSPKNVADRVNLGLIPTSSMSWNVACEALNQDTGGWLHIHENVESSRQTSERTSLDDPINRLTEPNINHCACVNDCLVTRAYRGRLTNEKRVCWCSFSTKLVLTFRGMFENNWNVELKHIEYVKSYAPHVDHLVFDVECRPMSYVAE